MYQIENPIGKAMSGMNQAAGTYGRMGQDIPANRDPGPTTGGAINAGMGGAAMGATIGSYVTAGSTAGSTAGPWGAAAGAVVGIGAYLMS